ncbi:MFS transporter [Alicyclobacillus sp. SO9]|uniref:MFS transporter n=1 Tax=Alicyclobacillus sp. SO9 TaxID=2665646 RepID=UPI0018E88F68|nr:MFS transporter [Alicyclobacillus sp. SO9]QQE78072.1 MFS transporter [Alicyclobacillus sp. SO9]
MYVTRNKQSTALTLFAIGVFMGGLDNGIMSSALTTLVHSFKVSASWGAWLITIYTLGLAISVPIMSKFSDKYGRKKMFLLSIALFGAGSMCVALSHSFVVILLSRVLQSLGGGGIFPIANGYIVATVPVKKQGRALGMVGGMNGISAILGPNIGSFILSATHDWHWLFWINVPIAVLLVIWGARGLEESKAEGTGSLDKIGIILMSLGVLGLMYGLTNLKGAHLLHNLGNSNVWAYAGIGVLLLVIVLWYENRIDKKGRDSLVPMSLLRQSELRWTLLIGFMSGLLLSSVIFLPAFIQVILGWPSSQAGYWYTPMALASGVGAMGGGAFMDKRGPIVTLAFGAVAAAIGSILFPLWVHTTWQMVVASSLVGLGVGVTLGAPLNFLITEKVPQNKSTALGMLSLVREIGLTLGPTIYAGFLTRGMALFPEKLMQNLKSVGISPSQIPTSELNRMNHVSGFGSISGQIDKIPSLPIRHAVSQALLAAGQVGFHHLYWSAFWISIASLFCILIVKIYRNRPQQGSKDGTSEAATLV